MKKMRRLITSLIAFIIFLSCFNSSAITTAENTRILAGDVNNDGKVDVTDISTLALILADRKDMTPDQIVRADVTNNGKVELADLARIRQFISRVINSLDPNK